MAALEQIDALRKQNKDLLKNLKKQTEKLHQLTLSWPDEKDKSRRSEYEAFTVGSVFLTERNGAQPSPSSPTALKTIKISDEHVSEHCEDPTPDQHKHKHKPSSEVTKYSTLLQDSDNSRWKGRSRSVRLMLPKSAPLTADGDQRETDSATTAGLEDTVSERHMQPLLGYDWIAGLLDAESSLADRSEQFFSELRSFRQVNRDELPSVADLASSTLDGEEPQAPADTHQCKRSADLCLRNIALSCHEGTFCYRINSRLFAVPLDAQAACPVCKMPKSEHSHTETEPALIRVSIPRSTLLPAHQYKAHRRCSFDSSDSLSLPSHCLSGWSNPTLNSGSQMSSLDLRGSMTKPAATRGSFSSWFDNKLLFPFIHASCPKKCANEDKNQVEVVPCTQKSNRVCFCKPGFYCEERYEYNTYCHRCVPCETGTFSSKSSLDPICTRHTDCARLGMEKVKEGNATQDRECAYATAKMEFLYTPSSIINTINTASTLKRGEHQILSNSQSNSSTDMETKIPLGNNVREVKSQNMEMTPQSGVVRQVTVEHNGRGENVNNTVGSIYIYSPGTVILGSNSGDKKEEAGVCEEAHPLIGSPQQESNPPSQEVRIRISAQEQTAEEELSLSFPVPATGK
ncbi:Migration and invasion-inhibitory protein [Anabarilius grahami]|uniref:Migration and invasion-inhibitory protein n=1 Tax=Anabarilius grahami TaxID=495550 RepID=A0A3N0XGZ6_ANAGA|nr:Migration and invasion-inhibitory protein [Anabarilius grahami]